MTKSRRTEWSTVLSSFCDNFCRFSSAILTSANLPFLAFLCALCIRSGDPLDRPAFFPPLNFKEVQYLCKRLANLLHSGLISLECLSENSLSRWGKNIHCWSRVFRNRCNFELYQIETQAFAFDWGQVFNSFAQLFFYVVDWNFWPTGKKSLTKSGVGATALWAWCWVGRRMQSTASLHWTVASIMQ